MRGHAPQHVLFREVGGEGERREPPRCLDELGCVAGLLKVLGVEGVVRLAAGSLAMCASPSRESRTTSVAISGSKANVAGASAASAGGTFAFLLHRSILFWIACVLDTSEVGALRARLRDR